MKKQIEEAEETEPETYSRKLQSLNLKADRLGIWRRKMEAELKAILENKI